MENLLISACLLGVQCRYDGGSKPVMPTVALMEQYHLIPICPEQLGGLPTPREPSERRADTVVSRSGADVTAQFRRGAEQALHLARLYGCKAAVLKERSPSCGSGEVYDGVDERHWLPGEGIVPWKEVVTTLMESGYRGPFLFELRKGENGQYHAKEVLDCFKNALK